MAKKGLDYFSFDVGFFDNDKVALIEAEFGMKGVFVLLKLLCKIYSEGYYCEWGEDQCLLFTSRKLKPSIPEIDAKYTQKVVNALLRRNFFNQEIYNEYSVLTSKNIQERYYEVAKRRQSADLDTPFWLLSESKNVNRNEENVNRNEENVCRISQSKVKERKEKENKEKESIYPPPQTPPPCGEVVSSSEGGGGGNFYKLYEGLCDMADVREDVYDAVAISNCFANELTSYYTQWLGLTAEQRRGYPLNDLNNAIRGQNPQAEYERWRALCWVRDNTLGSEWQNIYGLASTEKALFELRKLVKECKKGKIAMPGKFIIKHLTALRL